MVAQAAVAVQDRDEHQGIERERRTQVLPPPSFLPQLAARLFFSTWYGPGQAVSVPTEVSASPQACASQSFMASNTKLKGKLRGCPQLTLGCSPGHTTLSPCFAQS